MQTIEVKGAKVILFSRIGARIDLFNFRSNQHDQLGSDDR
jgi:hypothetical protein